MATSVQHSVREFCYYAFKRVGIELEFQGEGENEKGIIKSLDPELSTLNSQQVTKSSKYLQISIVLQML